MRVMSEYKNCQRHIGYLDPCQPCTRLVVTDVNLAAGPNAQQVWAKHTTHNTSAGVVIHTLLVSDTKPFCADTFARLIEKTTSAPTSKLKAKAGKASAKKKR